MIVLCSRQVWWSWVHTPARTVGQKWPFKTALSRGLFNFAQIMYRVYKYDSRSAAKRFAASMCAPLICLCLYVCRNAYRSLYTVNKELWGVCMVPSRAEPTTTVRNASLHWHNSSSTTHVAYITLFHHLLSTPVFHCS